MTFDLVNAMQEQELSQPSLAFVVESWKPDLERFKLEVDLARASGAGDWLTLAEMECSLDLIDADLAALRANKTRDARTEKSTQEAADLRDQLSALIEQLRPLCQSMN